MANLCDDIVKAIVFEIMGEEEGQIALLENPPLEPGGSQTGRQDYPD